MVRQQNFLHSSLWNFFLGGPLPQKFNFLDISFPQNYILPTHTASFVKPDGLVNQEYATRGMQIS